MGLLCLPLHSWLQLSCGDRNQDASLSTHTQGVAVRYRQCHKLLPFLDTPEKVFFFVLDPNVMVLSEREETLRECDLNHPGMITSVVPRPWCTILHHPSFFRFLLSFSH